MRFHEDDDLIGDLYTNLLARAMDGERVGEVHPAFVGLISQLAPDEIVFIRQLSTQDFSLIIKFDEEGTTHNKANQEDFIRSKDEFSAELIRISLDARFKTEELNQPDLFWTFLDHLISLEIVEFTGMPHSRGPWKGAPTHVNNGPSVFFIQISRFGRLFFKACIHSEPKNIGMQNDGHT